METYLLILILAALAAGIVYKYIEVQKQKKSSSLHTAAHEYQPGDIVITNIIPQTSAYRQELISRLAIGDELLVTREKDHPSDANAIQVLYSGHLTDLRDIVIGHLEPDLAEKIAPILDEFAVGAQRFVDCRVIALNNAKPPLGVQIKFKLPTEEDLKHQRDKRSIEQFL